jgi:ribonuclease P protein component
MKNFNKIKTYGEIKNITNKGVKTVLKSTIVYKLKASQENAKIEVGFLLSKKFGNAVKRNKTRRKIVGVLNDLKPNGNYDAVFIPRNSILKMTFFDLKNELTCVLS